MISSGNIQFLGFALLAPMYLLAGAVLASVPIIIHFLNRRRYRVVPWAAMEWLLAAIKKNRRRLRFESWLLLATRCAALLLLGLALSRPMGCGGSSLAALGQRASLNVFVIDNSYSMGYRYARGTARTHLDQAKVIAHELIARMQGGSDSVSLLTAAAPAGQVIAHPTYDLSDADAAVNSISQTAGGTDLAGALQQAMSIARQDKVPNKHLYILTDSTRGALDTPEASALKQLGRELAGQYKITYFNLGRPEQTNIAISSLHPTAHLVTTKFNTALAARVHNFGAHDRANVQWTLDGRDIGDSRAEGDSAVQSVMVDNVNFATGGAHVVSAAVQSGDPLAIDDRAFAVVQAISRMKVLLVEGDMGSGPTGGSASFLNVALAPMRQIGGQRDSYIQPQVISDLQLSNQALSDYRAVVLANVPRVGAHEADALAEYVRGGGTLAIFMGELVNAENYNQMLLPRGLMPGALVRRVSAPADTSGFHFDFRPDAPLNPLLQFLRNQPRSGLDTAEISTYWKIDLPANSRAERVLNYMSRDKGQGARDKGEEEIRNPKPEIRNKSKIQNIKSIHPSSLNSDPAITLQTVGQGRVLFVTTTADAQWTTLPAKPVYVPLMHELLQGSIVPEDGWMNLLVGQRLVLPGRIKVGTAPTLTMPDGTRVSLAASGSDGGYKSAPLREPGIYHLNTGLATYPIAVNPPPAEADVRTEPPSAIETIFGGASMDIESDQVPAPAIAADESSDFGWIVMIVLFGLLGAECFMAMRFGHGRRRSFEL